MLNLLPKSYKEALAHEQNFRLALILGILAISFLVSFFLLLLAMRIYVEGQIEVRRITVESQRTNAEEENPVARIRGLNSTVSAMDSFYASQLAISGTLSKVTAMLPRSVYITSFNYTPASGVGENGEKVIGKVSLAGVASTSDDLLQLKENLEEDP